MTLPGGPANKLGNRYEKWWTLWECVRLLHGKTEEIRIESPGFDKAEFIVRAGSRREFHQVKRSHPNDKWSLIGLESDGLLRTIGDTLTGNDDRFVFVSGSSARELADLCETARDAETVEEFRQEFLKAANRKQAFEKLRNIWKCGDRDAVDRLKRIDIHTISERDIEEKVRLGLQVLFIGNTDAVLAEIRAIIEDSIHRTVNHQYLKEKLTRQGYRTRRLPNPENAGFVVQDVTERYLKAAEQRLIRRELVPREATQALEAVSK